ncbi:MAG: glycosyltransferase [Alphaproteobacteria bacterium]|nr:glycosyltransferase [Alphaproteobacteria bacterium]
MSETPSLTDYNIAVLVPCHNEAVTVEAVVQGFRASLPTATVYVYDNNCTDGTAAIARAAGAVVRTERLAGKGNVVRRMFSDIEADIYVMVDGDDTYDAAAAPEMVERLITGGYDLVSGARVTDIAKAYRPGHRFGNRLLTSIVAWIFNSQVTDMLSGYRVFSRRFVKSFPVLARGFEIETELTVHALEMRLPTDEVATAYKDRPPGSASKLNTIRDGFRIFLTILILVKEERPLPFFSLVALVIAAAAILLAVPLIETFINTGTVPRLPTAILSTGLMILSFLSLACGFVLDTVTHGRRELKRLFYLAQPVPARHEPKS